MALVGTDITEAVKYLDKGSLVAVPTETVYGLAGNALDTAVVAKIFEVKGRPAFDPLIVHIPDYQFMGRVAHEVPEAAAELARRLWPGPLTLVLPRRKIIPDLVTSGLDTVAIRVPNHPITLELLQLLDYPLACPSANPFGYVSPTRASHVQQQLGDQIPYILDGGPCEVGIESTIVGFDQGKGVIYRPGGITVENIEKIIGKVIIKTSVSNPVTPGMLENHYSPGKTLILGSIKNLLGHYGDEKIAILTYRDIYPEVPEDHQIQLSPAGDLKQAAQNLFASLRKLDAMDISYIFAEPVPNHGLGIAINDRLTRAATKLKSLR
ncbi:MAG: threonylcarbamoyl-AMP synthase [Cyclobacteriaceae bacterium]|nr:MAG: threonylcarbamoyl-AMP synthase [Cyclobacteriaceae bacterium]